MKLVPAVASYSGRVGGVKAGRGGDESLRMEAVRRQDMRQVHLSLLMQHRMAQTVTSTDTSSRNPDTDVRWGTLTNTIDFTLDIAEASTNAVQELTHFPIHELVGPDLTIDGIHVLFWCLFYSLVMFHSFFKNLESFSKVFA